MLHFGLSYQIWNVQFRDFGFEVELVITYASFWKLDGFDIWAISVLQHIPWNIWIETMKYLNWHRWLFWSIGHTREVWKRGWHAFQVQYVSFQKWHGSNLWVPLSCWKIVFLIEGRLMWGYFRYLSSFLNTICRQAQTVSIFICMFSPTETTSSRFLRNFQESVLFWLVRKVLFVTVIGLSRSLVSIYNSS